tara:strand:+ start:2722 stop:3033 length:312 start_codon:yes stop_codon:yes gene_type:complete
MGTRNILTSIQKTGAKTMSNNLQTPIVNLNGSDKATLLGEYRWTYEALETAILALQKTMPHGRDYPDGTDTLMEARDQHLARLRAVIDVQRDIEHIALAVLNQ